MYGTMFRRASDNNGHQLPGVDRFAQEEACVPVGFWLSEDDINYIVKVLNDFYSKLEVKRSQV